MRNKVIGTVVLFTVFGLYLFIMGRVDNGFETLLIVGWGFGIFLVGYGASLLSSRFYKRNSNPLSYLVMCTLLIIASVFTYSLSLNQGYDIAFTTVYTAFAIFLSAVTVVGYYLLLYKRNN